MDLAGGEGEDAGVSPASGLVSLEALAGDLLKLWIHIVNGYNDFINAFLCGYSLDDTNKAFSGLDEAIVFDGKNHQKSPLVFVSLRNSV